MGNNLLYEYPAKHHLPLLAIEAERQELYSQEWPQGEGLRQINDVRVPAALFTVALISVELDPSGKHMLAGAEFWLRDISRQFGSYLRRWLYRSVLRPRCRALGRSSPNIGAWAATMSKQNCQCPQATGYRAFRRLQQSQRPARTHWRNTSRQRIRICLISR